MDDLARLLKESWTLVEDRRDRLAEYFYARMFLLDPALRPLFPVQMSGQRDRLLEAVVTAVHSVDNPERFNDFLGGLGRDHRKYHVRPEHYATVGRALLDALRAMAGERWAVEYDQAWRDAYQAITEKMLAGADSDLNPPYWHAEVLSHKRLASDVAVFTCQALQHPFPYAAGQYVSVEAPRYHPRVWRTYSIANAPNEDNVLEFHIRSLNDGWLSRALVRRLKPGDLLRIAAPMGSMTLDLDSERNVLCAAEGVGLAPIKALVEELTRVNRLRRVHVLVGARKPDRLYGLRYLYHLAECHDWLSITPVCREPDDLLGAPATVAEAIDQAGPWTDHDCFVAGPADMVRATHKALVGQGVPTDQIKYDAFFGES